MALIYCPECGKENVSDTAEACPSCGYSIRKHFEKIKLEEKKTIEEEKKLALQHERKEKIHNEFKYRKRILIAAVCAVVIVLGLVGVIVFRKNVSSKSGGDTMASLADDNKKDSFVSKAFQKTDSNELIFTDLQVGQTVQFGKYEQDLDKKNGEEPIEWIVMSIQDERALLVSKYILDHKPYNDIRSDRGADTDSWETCSLRMWLNDTFFNSAFSDKEKKIIQLTHLENVGYTNENETDDNVFILSPGDLLDLYGNSIQYDNCFISPELVVSPTDYDRYERQDYTDAHIIDEDDVRNFDRLGFSSSDVLGKIGTSWWVRTFPIIVDGEGIMKFNVHSHTKDAYGIRPALYISYDSASGATVSSDADKSEMSNSTEKGDKAYAEPIQFNGTEYRAAVGSSLVKVGDEYCLYPAMKGTLLYTTEEPIEAFPFTEPLHVSKEAKIGILTDVYEEFNGEYYEMQYVYDYKDFYKTIDSLFEEKRWVQESNTLYFEYNGELMSFAPCIIVNDKGEIIAFKEYSLDENMKQDVVNNNTTDKGSTNDNNDYAKKADKDNALGTATDSQYYSQGCRLVKQEEFYYLYPMYSGERLININGKDFVPFPDGRGIKVSADARVGIATSVSFSEDEYGIACPVFQYEYKEFYDVIENLLETKHWQSIDMGYGPDTFAFEVDDMVVMNLTLISFNTDGEIIQLMDFYTE